MKQQKRIITYLSAGCALMASLPVLAQDHVIPFAESRNLTGPEFAQAGRELDRLEREAHRLHEQLANSAAERRPTQDIEKRLADIYARQRDIQALKPATLVPLMDDMMERVRHEINPLVPDPFGQTPIRLEQAQQLGDLFYTDLGEPRVNHRWQVYVLGGIRKAAQHPAIPPEACQLLRKKLMTYYEGQSQYHAPGRLVSPTLMFQLADALYRVSDQDDAQAHDLVVRLRHNVLDWTAALEQHERRDQYAEALNRAVETWDELRRLREPGVHGDRHAGADGFGKSGPGEVKKNARATQNARLARSTIESALRRFNWDARKITEITQLGLGDYGNRSTNENMIKRLLIAYRRILEKPRTVVSSQVVAQIDANLLILAKDSKKLTTNEHWRLWSRAVVALRDRASTVIKTFLAEKCKPQQHGRTGSKISKTRERAIRYAWSRIGK